MEHNTNEKGLQKTLSTPFRYAQYERQLTGVSYGRALKAGIAQPTVNVSMVRWSLKEADRCEMSGNESRRKTK